MLLTNNREVDHSIVCRGGVIVHPAGVDTLVLCDYRTQHQTSWCTAGDEGTAAVQHSVVRLVGHRLSPGVIAAIEDIQIERSVVMMV